MVLLSEPVEPQKLLSAKKLARRLDVCPRTIYRMVKRGDLPSPQRRGPKNVGWFWNDVLAWIKGSADQALTRQTSQAVPGGGGLLSTADENGCSFLVGEMDSLISRPIADRSAVNCEHS